MSVWRQGDVLIMQVEGDIQTGNEVKRENGKLFLAYGEVTGHAHTVEEKTVAMFGDEANRVIVAAKPWVIEHQEHAPVELPAGTFRVIYQREYTPAAIRRVVD